MKNKKSNESPGDPRFSPFVRALKIIQHWLLSMHAWTIRHPRLTVAALLTSLATSVQFLPQLRVLISIDDLADKDFLTYNQLKDLKQRFLDQNEIFVVIRRDDGVAPQKPDLCAIQKWVQTTSDSRGDIRAIVSTLSVSWPTETLTSFQANPLLAPDCADIHKDQSGEFKAAFEKIARSPWAGTLTSSVADDVAVVFFPAHLKKSRLFGSFDSTIVTDLQSSFSNSVIKSRPNLIAAWAGDGIFQFHLQKGYEAMPLLNLMMCVLVIILFRIFFGTFKSSFIFLQLVAWVSMPIYGLMAVVGAPIDVLSSSLSLMFFISSLEDFIFVTRIHRDWGWRRSFRRVIMPCFFTSLTTVVGFGSLAFADLGMIRRFGLWAAVGAAFEWVVLFLFLPAALVLFPSWQNWVNRERSWEPKLHWLLDFRPRRWMTAVALLIFPLSLWSTHLLHVSDSPERLLPANSQPRKDLHTIEQTRGWRANVSLVFKDVDQKQFNLSVIEKVNRWPLVTQIEDFYKVRSFMTDHLSAPMKNYMTDSIDQNTLGRRLGPSGMETRAIVYLKGLDIIDVNKMRHQVNDLCPKGECWLAGSLVTYGELGERVLSTLYHSLGISLVLVLGILGFLALAIRPRAFLPLAISSLWGPAALLVVFAIFQLPIFYITSMIASIIVGLAGDNAIQFLFFSGSDRGTHGSLRSLQKGVSRIGIAAFLVAFFMVLESTVFFFGYFEPMRLLGLMMMIGIALAFLGDVWILRGLSETE